jgi:hypothetical protein
MTPHRNDVRAELRRIAVSRTFAMSHGCCALLDQLVRDFDDQKYQGGDAGAGMNLGTNLAAAVQLARLRNKLSDYYAAEGLGNPLRIRVPDEGYQVCIDVVEPAGEQMHSDVNQSSREAPWLF